MSAGAFVEHLERYAASFDAPVVTGVAVTRLTADRPTATRPHDGGTWRARSVVLATGPHGRPFVPASVGPAEWT